jgi:DNA-binding NarL/FixJ family response regulator
MVGSRGLTAAPIRVLADAASPPPTYREQHMFSAAVNHHHTHMDVAICDRREFDRAALRALCSNDRDLSVVAEVEQPDQLTQALPAGVRLVILIGRSMLRGDGGDPLERIRRDLPQARIVVVGIGDERGATAVPPGSDGFLPRDGELADQLAAVYGI